MNLRKLLTVATLFVTSALGFNANAYTTDDLVTSGWAKVESITDVDNNYYVFVGAGSSEMAMTALPAYSGRAFYYPLQNPLNNKSAIWILEATGDENVYALKSESRNQYFVSGNWGWDNGFNSANDGGNYTFTLADGKYSLRSTKAGGLIGPWNDNANEANGEISIAANKNETTAPGFYIYSMSRSDYATACTANLTTLESSASKDAPVEMTSWIFNPDLSWQNHNDRLIGWNRNGGWGNQQAGNTTFESWNNNNVNVYQDLTGLPNGLYKVTVDIISGPDRPLNAYLYAKGQTEVKSANVSVFASDGKYDTMGAEVAGNTVVADNVVVNDGKLTIGIKDPSSGNGWIVFDNFKLWYYGSQVDLTIYIDAYNAALNAAKAYQSAEMSDFALTALNTAITNNTIADPANSTQEALETATANLNIAADYAKGAVETMSIVNSGVIPTNTTDGWAISTRNDSKLQYNTWSNEYNDGSGLRNNFLENWLGAGNPLTKGESNGSMYYTLRGLTPGKKYAVTALVRAFNESNTGATGASYFVGETKKSLEIYGYPCFLDFASKGRYAYLTSVGTVGADGTLTFGIELEKSSLINWIAIKDVKIREAADAVPTAITLNKTSISMNPSEVARIAATLTASGADDMSIGWSSSDESVVTVKNGIVTAVKPGSATITAIAGGNESLTATVAVTVDYAAPAKYASSLANGQFYIRNVGTGSFFGQGNDYDAQASIVAHGKPITLTQLENGKYKITDIMNGENGLGDNSYVDNGGPAEFEITEVSPQIYTIKLDDSRVLAAEFGSTVVPFRSADASDVLAQWQLLTVDDLELALSETGKGDATFYVEGALVQRESPTNTTSWEIVNADSKHNGDWGNWYAFWCTESWNKDSFSYKQTVNVPNGKYKVSVQGFSRDAATAELFANDESVELAKLDNYAIDQMVRAARAFISGLYYNELEVEVTDNTLELGVRGATPSATWAAWNNFELTLIEAAETEVGLNSDGGYYTLILPFAAELPEGMKAYTCSEVNDDVLVLNESASFAPNVPYIVEGGAGNHVFSGYSIAKADTYTYGLLTGVYAETEVPSGNYVLASKDGGDPKFYVVGATLPKLPAYRAYLTAPAESEVKAFRIGGEATGINAIEALNAGDAEIYTINGVRVNTLQKGVNIVKMSNGKTQKVLVK